MKYPKYSYMGNGRYNSVWIQLCVMRWCENLRTKFVDKFGDKTKSRKTPSFYIVSKFYRMTVYTI